MNKSARIAFKTGGVAAFFILLLFLTTYFIPRLGAWDKIRLTDALIPIVFLFIGLKFFRDKLNQGELRFWQGLYLGTVFSVTMIFFTLVIIAILMYWIDPSYITKSNEIAINLLDQEKLNTMKIHHLTEEKLKELEQYKYYVAQVKAFKTASPGLYLEDIALRLSVISILFTFILSAVLRR